MRWTEPTEVRNKFYPYYSRFPIWSHVLFGASILITIALLSMGPQEDGLIKKVLVFGFCISLGAFISYFFAWIDIKAGATIIINSTGIERMDTVEVYEEISILDLFGYRHRKWKWKKIAYLYLCTEELENQSFQILKIIGYDEKILAVVGLPLEYFNMDKLLSVLNENNCQLRGLEEE